MATMKTIRKGDTGAAVEDVQQRLELLGYLTADEVTSTFDDETAAAVVEFCKDYAVTPTDEVDAKVWAALVDATFHLGDRTLYLRMPYLHGHDVLELQRALGALGFFYGDEDGIFGAHTEDALRKFQMNLGLPSDGIAGAYTFSAIHNLEHSWVGKGGMTSSRPLGFARAADVLEENALCLFGTEPFTRSVASRMSNLALATNPASKIVSAEALSVTPDESMLLVHVALQPGTDATPTVWYEDEATLPMRMASALKMPQVTKPLRIRVVLPGTCWFEAGEERSAQHFAITLLDALCTAL